MIPDTVTEVTVTLPLELARKLIRPWYLIKAREAHEIRETIAWAIVDLDDPDAES